MKKDLQRETCVVGQHCRWLDRRSGYSEHGAFLRKTMFGNYVFSVQGSFKEKVISKNDESLVWFHETLYSCSLPERVVRGKPRRNK